MDRKQAIAKLRKLIGSNIAWRESARAPANDEEREAARALFLKTRDEKKAAQEAMESRRAEVLAADERYQALKAHYIAANKRHEALGMRHLHYRVEVGRSSSLGPGFGVFHVDAEGDNWSDVVEKVLAKRAQHEEVGHGN